MGGGTRAREGGSRGFGFGGVGGRGTGPRDGANFVTCVVFSCIKRRKMIFFEGYSVGWEGCKGSGGGSRGFGFGGVGGRGTGPTNANTPNPCIPAHARDRNQVKTVLSEPSLDANTKCPSLHPCTCWKNSTQCRK